MPHEKGATKLGMDSSKTDTIRKNNGALRCYPPVGDLCHVF